MIHVAHATKDTNMENKRVGQDIIIERVSLCNLVHHIHIFVLFLLSSHFAVPFRAYVRTYPFV